MNKEIEYRAWDKETKLMFEVLSIDFQNKTVVLKPTEEHNLELYNFSKMSDGKFVCGIERKFDEVELEEYTRKNDKNNKKIFEGSIIKFKEWSKGEFCWIGEVVYDYGSMYVVRGNPNKECDSPFETQLSRLDSERIEVIGNIYDKELEETYGNN